MIAMTRTQTQISIGILLTLLTAALIIYVGLTEEKRMSSYAAAQQAEAIEVGADLFEINCSGCHGLKAQGIPGLAPPLNDRYFFTQRLEEVGWEGSLEDYIIATISTGRPVSTRPDQYPGGGSPAMPAWSEEYGGPLREDQIRNIAAFIMNWKPIALGQAEIAELPTPTPRPEEADNPIARGQRVFTERGCGGCHTIQGLSAGTLAPNLTQIGKVAASRKPDLSAEEYIRESILTPTAFVVEGYQPIMPQNYGEQLSQQELDDLVAFLLAQK